MKRGRLLAREGESCARQSRNSLRRSRAQEKFAASDLGGSVVVASGAKWHSKGDVKSSSILLECKTTEADSYRVRAEDLKKLVLQAIMAGRVPVMQIELGNDTKWALIEWELFLEVWGEHGSSATQCNVPDHVVEPRSERRDEASSVPERAKGRECPQGEKYGSGATKRVIRLGRTIR
jgi:hypothetical protein